MLSEKSRPYIEASVPVLREHGLTITRAFYRNMFAEHPELTNLFNMGNQANGSQQRSLASAVFAYAANYRNPDALAPVVSRIVHKHVSVGIAPDHYPIVGRHLLGAIREVLGEATATPALIDAWAEAYGLLADALIAAERALYGERGTEPGKLREMRVREVTPQAANVTSFALEPTDGLAPWPFTPGQYVSVAVDLPDGARQLRQYSLSDAPGRDAPPLRISVKRETAGEAAAGTPAGRVSNHLHDRVRAGDLLYLTPPSGDFAPAGGSGPLVLLSAGVGITPMISALNHLARVDPDRQVVFAHAARDRAHHAHRGDVAAAREKMPNLRTAVFYEQPDANDRADGVHPGFMDVAAALPEWSRSADADVFLCGPLPFLRAQEQALCAAGVPRVHIHREVFGPEMLDELG